jgi:predicted SprT family Zn-dependent metalloprotease
VQAMRRVEHLRAQPHKKRVQAMRRLKHLRAQPPKKQVQAMRRVGHLRAQPQRYFCKQCGGSSICEHSRRIRKSCKDCRQKQELSLRWQPD